MSAPVGLQSLHFPVLCDEVIACLSPEQGKVYVDGTFGCGGYTKAILNAHAHVIAIDRDPEAIERAQEFVREFSEQFRIVQGSFSEMQTLLASLKVAEVDGVVLDLGVSSPQFDQPERGFSFRFDGPLDMRMSTEGMTAAEWLNQAEESEIANVIYLYGEERQSRRVARAIVRRREEAPLLRTQELADLIRSVLGKKSDIHPATKTFMALRIHINDELGELRKVLEAAEKVIRPGGRLVVVTFHSLEDRIVKEFLTPKSKEITSRYHPSLGTPGAPKWQLLTRKPVVPSKNELAENPRSRSAKLRAAIRLQDDEGKNTLGESGCA